MLEAMKSTYWAAGEPKELLSHLAKNKEQWTNSSVSSGVFQGYISAYWRNTMAYYAPLLAPDSWGSSLNFDGEKGEIIKMKVAKARTQIRQHFSLLSRSRMNFESIVDIADAQPQITAKLARQISSHLRETLNLEQKKQRAAEWADVLGMSFVCTLWRNDKGTKYMAPSEGKSPIMTGEVSIQILNIADVIWDWTVDDWMQISQAMCRIKRNRWDVIAEIEQSDLPPEEKEVVIRKLKGVPAAETERKLWNNLSYLNTQTNDDSIYVYYWFHRPSPALPEGRFVQFAGEDILLFDGENPYEGIPIEPVIFEPIKDTTLGYPLLSSLLPAQEMLDAMFSAMATNASQNAVGAMYNPIGSQVSVADMGGMKFINYMPQNATGGGKPEPVIWPAMGGDQMQFQDRIINAMDEISMLNDTLRGRATANVTSGAMAATLSANALEFFSAPQQALDRAFENSMNHAFVAYKNLATTEQIILVSGDSAVGYAKEFKSEQIQNLKRVRIKTTNPLLTQVSGRLQMFESLTQQGLIRDPFKAFQILEGAPVETLFKAEWTEQIAIQQEIDMLFEGRDVFPLQTDNHPLYIAGYKEILNNPEIRVRGDLAGKIAGLIKIRVEMEMSLDPMTKALLRGQPMPDSSQAAQQNEMMGAVTSQPTAPERASPAEPAQPIPTALIGG